MSEETQNIVEGFMVEVRAQLRTIDVRLSKLETRFDTAIPTLATKADLEAIRTTIETIRTSVESGKTRLATLEPNLIKWLIGTAATIAALAFALAKLIH